MSQQVEKPTLFPVTDLEHEIILYSQDAPARATTHVRSIELSASLTRMFDAAQESVMRDGLPIPAIHDVHPSNELFSLLCEWLDYHRLHPEEHVDFKNESCEKAGNWDEEFLKRIGTNHEVLFSLLLLANFLEVPELLQLCCKYIARNIIHRSAEEVRKYFNIPADFNPPPSDDEEEVAQPMEVEEANQPEPMEVDEAN